MQLARAGLEDEREHAVQLDLRAPGTGGLLASLLGTARQHAEVAAGPLLDPEQVVCVGQRDEAVAPADEQRDHLERPAALRGACGGGVREGHSADAVEDAGLVRVEPVLVLAEAVEDAQLAQPAERLYLQASVPPQLNGFGTDHLDGERALDFVDSDEG